MQAALLATLSLSLLWFSATATDDYRPLDCSLVRCARPLCANPVTPPGQCCPSCENSNCKFEGCVNFLPDGGVQWSPTPCLFCICDVERNEKITAIIDCFFLTKEDCCGFPVVTRDNECCPSCDFGTRERGCFVVPQIFGKQNITVSDRSNTCSTQVVKKTCDKASFRTSRGQKFRCDAREGKRKVKFGENCPLCDGTYTDTVRCRARRDNDIIVGCDLVV